MKIFASALMAMLFLVILGLSPLPAGSQSMPVPDESEPMPSKSAPMMTSSSMGMGTPFEGTHRASRLIGAEVTNNRQEDLGRISDLVVDPDGRVSYLILSRGGIMGVGGGFLTFPIFVYTLGVSSMTTVGTDIFQIIFTAGYASITQYAIYGFIFYTLAMGMLLGSLVGIQIGAMATKVVPGITIRGFFALSVMAGFVNRIFALPAKLSSIGVITLSKEAGSVLDTIGIWAFFIVIGLFAVWVIGTFLKNIPVLRGEEVKR